MRIKDVIEKIRNVSCIMIHKDGGSKSFDVNELDDIDGNLEFSWFEVTEFRGKQCIEFNI